MSNNTVYESPFSTRYASREMQYLFSPDMKFTTWRRLWIALAEAEQREGLDITDEQIAQMKAHVDDVDYEAAAAYEKKLRHDVMAHIHAWGDQIPEANNTPRRHIVLRRRQYRHDNNEKGVGACQRKAAKGDRKPEELCR